MGRHGLQREAGRFESDAITFQTLWASTKSLSLPEHASSSENEARKAAFRIARGVGTHGTPCCLQGYNEISLVTSKVGEVPRGLHFTVPVFVHSFIHFKYLSWPAARKAILS